MADRNSSSLTQKLLNHYLLTGVAACAALAGCAAAPPNQDVALVASEPGRAVVIGWGNSPGEKARAALTPGQGAHVSSLFVAKANEQKAGFGENIARLPPGQYELTITCGLYVDYRFFPHDTVVQADLRANHVYRLRASPEGRKCQPYLEDATGAGK